MNQEKKNGVKSRIIIIVALVSIPIIICALFYFGGLNSYKEEIGKYDSPGGTYTVIAYRTNVGATTSFGVECRLHKNSGLRDFGRKIFTEYPQDSAEVIWEDDDTVIINDTRIEDVTKDKEHIYHTKPVPTEQNH